MAAFRGWSPAVIDFYRGLEADNSKSYWQAHKATFDAEVRAPFDALSEAVEVEFGPLKVFRPNRDVRFSKDKSPYKTHCYGVTEGEGGTGYYVGISAQGLAVGCGYWMMAKDQLARFREAVADDARGPALEAAVAELRRSKFEIEGHGLKTAPRGYPKDHPRIELLRCKSLAAIRNHEPAAWLGTPKALDRIVEVWRAGAPMNAWLDANVGPSTEPPDDRWSR